MTPFRRPQVGRHYRVQPLRCELLEDRRVLASAWHNVLAPLNVDDADRVTVSPIDALLVINELSNRHIIDDTGRLPDEPVGISVPPYLDVNDDHFVSPLDALLVINALSDDAEVDAAIADELAQLLADSPDLTIEYAAAALGYPLMSGESIVEYDTQDVPPATATASDGGTVVAWVSGDDAGGEKILTQRYSASGVPIGAETTVAMVDGVVRSVDIGLTSNDDILVTWAQRTEDGWDVYVQGTDREGQPFGPRVVSETTSGTQQTPAIAVASNDDYAVVWQDDRNNSRQIMARFFGVIDSGEVLLTPGSDESVSHLQPDVAAWSDSYFIAWTTRRVGQAQLEGVYSDPTGQELSRLSISGADVSPSEISASSVTVNQDGSYAAVVWQQRLGNDTGWDVQVRGYDLSVEIQQPDLELRANEASVGTGRQPSVAMDNGDILVAWNGRGVDGAAGQFTRRYDIAGQAWMEIESVLNVHESTEPVLAADNGSALVASVDGDGRGVVARTFGANMPTPVDDLVAFAKSLAAVGTTFYGAAWCAHCTAQKELFEDGGPYLPFVEVTNPDRTPNQIGIDAQISTFPTWEFPDGSRLMGPQSLETLANRSGIPIPRSAHPSIAPIEDQTLLVGSPLHFAVDAYDPKGSDVTFQVTSSNPDVTPTLLSGGRSIRFDVNDFGDLVFYLFEQRMPRATERMIELSADDFYDGISFHRVINDFVIQAGDPSATGSGGSDLGDFDDQFDIDLQHNRTGLLSMAKTVDDTNDSQFFITEGPSRHLDFNHTIFGLLVEGETNRDAISNTETVASRPVIDVSIGNTEVFTDKENTAVMLKAASGATGSATITVVATNAAGLRSETSFTVSITADTINGGPFLTEFTDAFVTTRDTPVAFNLESVDVEGDDVFYDVSTFGAEGQYDVEIENDTGLVTVTPKNGFAGTISFLVGVRPLTSSDTTDTFDAQEVIIEVLDAP